MNNINEESINEGFLKNKMRRLSTKRKRKLKIPFLGIYSVLIYLFLYLPLFVVLFFSFSPTIVGFSGFTTKWYVKLFSDRGLVQSLTNSLQVSLLAVLIAIVLGVFGAFFLVRVKFPAKGAFRTLSQLPLILPGIIVGLALLIFFINLNVGLSMFTILIGHVSFTTPVVMFQVGSRLQRMGRTYEYAAQDLGANPVKTFWYVTLPMIRTAIMGGALLAFTISFDEIIITYFLTGTWTTLPVYIYGMMRFGLSPQVYAISAVILLLSVFIIFFVAKFTGTKGEEAGR
jgi:spermidine/putrescine transport system permease protein